jgi:outer membrane protein assembly factor BamB
LAFDAPSGAVRWSIELKVPGWEGPAVTRDGVFAGTVDGLVYRLNAETGREEWRVNVGAAVSTTPMVSANDLYVGTADGAIHRIDAARGTVTNTHKIDATLRPKSVPAKASDSVVVLLGDASADNRAVVSLDPALTTIRWRVSAEPRWTTSRVFVWGDVIVVGTPSGDVNAYCNKTGALTWSRSIKGSVRSIGGAEDLLLVGTQNGDLYAMRAPRSCDAK